jgi:hypothetical protein
MLASIVALTFVAVFFAGLAVFTLLGYIGRGLLLHRASAQIVRLERAASVRDALLADCERAIVTLRNDLNDARRDNDDDRRSRFAH